MRRKWIALFACLIAIWACTLWYSVLKSDAKDLSWIYNWFLDVVWSIEDEIRDNSVWCGSFQLAWDELLENVDAHFNNQVFDNLNKKTFTADQLPLNAHYSKNWLLTLDLKTEIEKWVKAKFNEDIKVSSFVSEWSIIPQSSDYYEWKKEKKYVLYSKFNKIINLKNTFEKLEDWNFADVYDDVKYFGINCNSNKKYDTVKILYYISDMDFAVSIKTWWWDDIILARWTKWKNFMMIYNLILSKERSYANSHKFTKYDCLKIPEINLKFEKEIYKLKNQKSSDDENDIYRIAKAIQDLEIKLDNPSWTKVNKTLTDSLPNIVWEKYHYLYFDKPFTIFIKEYNKDLPYFAAQISDIKLFQK